MTGNHRVVATGSGAEPGGKSTAGVELAYHHLWGIKSRTHHYYVVVLSLPVTHSIHF